MGTNKKLIAEARKALRTSNFTTTSGSLIRRLVGALDKQERVKALECDLVAELSRAYLAVPNPANPLTQPAVVRAVQNLVYGAVVERAKKAEMPGVTPERALQQAIAEVAGPETPLERATRIIREVYGDPGPSGESACVVAQVILGQGGEPACDHGCTVWDVTCVVDGHNRIAGKDAETCGHEAHEVDSAGSVVRCADCGADLTGPVKNIPAGHLPLRALMQVYRPGSGDWGWGIEYANLIDQPGTRELMEKVKAEGIREPILLGNDGRVWDGHHRITVAVAMGVETVPVEWSGSADSEGAEPVAYEVQSRRTGKSLDVWERLGDGFDELSEALSEKVALIPLYRHSSRKIDREALIDIICQNSTETFVHEVGQGRMVTPDAIEAIADAVIAHLEGGAA